MIRLLIRFANWLDKRFPPKVTINEETFNALYRRLNFLENARKSDDVYIRVASLEKTVTAIKESMIKGEIIIPKLEAQKLRDQFIKGELNRAPSRAEVESAA